MLYTTCRRAVRLLALPLLLVAGMGIARAEIIEQILVKVNGEIFTKTELEARQVAALRQRGQQIDLKSDPNNAQLRKALDEVTPQIIVDAVDEMLIVQRGHELGYRLSDEQFNQIVENIKKQNKIDTEEQWQAALKQENLTMPELRQQLEHQMIISRVQQNEVFGKIAVSEDEARQYYQTHQSEFTTPASITLREILVAVPTSGAGINVAQDDAAKQKAEDIRARIVNNGESFEKLAADLSDAPSRANAGLIGPINMTDLSADVQKLISGMKVGDVTQVLRTPRGYQIVKLESESKAETMPFEQAREQISQRVFTGKRQAEFQKYLAKLRDEAIIEWKNADIEKAYDAGLKAQAEKAKSTADKG
ncbi:MAG: peptidylprolyl isomerase [Betaproteobacteria bacterium]